MATRKKRPPRQVWITFNDRNGHLIRVWRTKKEGDDWTDVYPVVGPYVLAERRGRR